MNEGSRWKDQGLKLSALASAKGRAHVISINIVSGSMWMSDKSHQRVRKDFACTGD